MGWISWGIYGALSVFNFLFYSDNFYRKYVLSDFTEGAQWRTLNGNTEWIRTFLNVASWGIMLLFWSLTIFSGSNTFGIELFGYLTCGMGILTLAKFGLWILTFFVALIYDHPKYAENNYLYGYYVGLNGWGMWLGI